MHRAIVFRLVLFFCFIFSSSSNESWILPRSSSFHHAFELLQARVRNSDSLSTIESFTPGSLLPFTINNTICRKDLLNLVNGIELKDKWALKIIDSWGLKPPAGILEGSHLWFGSYDECLHPLYLINNQTYVRQPYSTKYCTISNENMDDDDPIFPPKPALIMGICLPDSCHSHDFHSKSFYVQCPSERQHFTIGAILTLILILLLSLFVCLANFLPCLHEYSALTNIKKIFSFHRTHTTYSFLNGIRVLSLFWIIFGHSFVFQLTIADNIVHVFDNLRNSFATQLITGAVFGVDTFFFISGFLAVYVFLNTFKSQTEFRIHHLFIYYLHRYVRLLPTLIFILLISIYLTPLMGTGPIYPTANGFETPSCRHQWWTTIFFLNNFIESTQSCLPVTWYLANDFQFHLLAPILLIPFIFNRRRLTYFLICLLIFINIITLICIISLNPGIENGMTINGDVSMDFFEKIYIKPWCRMGPFLIGMLTKLILEYYRSRLSWIRISFFTILSLVIIFICFYFPLYSQLFPRSLQIIYQILSRQLWSLAIGWLVLLCSIEQAGIVHRILSSSIWIIFARLSYAAYLIHTTIILTDTYNRLSTIHYQTSLIFSTFISQCFFTLIASVFVVVLVELPSQTFERRIRKFFQQKKQRFINQQNYGTIN